MKPLPFDLAPFIVPEVMMLQWRLKDAVSLLERIERNPENVCCNTFLRDDLRKFLADHKERGRSKPQQESTE